MSAQWSTGDLIADRWEIHDVRRSATGLVYAVYDRMLEEALAAKTLDPERLAAQPALGARFLAPARAWAALPVHAHIAQVRLIEIVHGQPVLFQELLTGGDLGYRVGTSWLTDAPLRVLSLAIQCCDALVHAAAHGVPVHGNLKTSNCLLTRHGTLKLSDFGLGTALHGLPPAPAGAGVSGELAYTAPERLDSAAAPAERSDIYAFGVMLYEMLTGSLPLWPDAAAAAPGPVVFDARVLIERFATLGRVVETCLAHDPERRFRDFRVLRAILADSYRQLTGSMPAAALAGPELEQEQSANRAAGLSELGRHTQALAVLEPALARAPHSARLWAGKGAALARQGDRTGARACYARALEIDGADAQTWRELGSLQRAAQQPVEALAALERALALEPRDGEAWLDKGRALEALGDDEEALESYRQALKRHPRCAPAWQQMAGIYRRRADTERAIDCLKRALGLEPHALPAWLALAALQRAAGRAHEELECYERACMLAPDSEEPLNRRAVVLGELGRFEEELACCERALQINPQSADGWFNRAVALVHLGRHAEAELALQHAERHGHAHAANAREALRATLAAG